MNGWTAKVGLRKSHLHRLWPTDVGLNADVLNRMDAAVRAAQARVASIPESHRRYLENEFQRAEADARAILRAKGPTQ